MPLNNPKEMAQIDSACEFFNVNCRAPIANAFGRIVLWRVAGLKASTPGAKTKMYETAQAAYLKLNDYLERTGDYFACGRVTAADFNNFGFTAMGVTNGFINLDELPALKKWFEKMCTVPELAKEYKKLADGVKKIKCMMKCIVPCMLSITCKRCCCT